MARFVGQSTGPPFASTSQAKEAVKRPRTATAGTRTLGSNIESLKRRLSSKDRPIERAPATHSQYEGNEAFDPLPVFLERLAVLRRKVLIELRDVQPLKEGEQCERHEVRVRVVRYHRVAQDPQHIPEVVDVPGNAEQIFCGRLLDVLPYNSIGCSSDSAGPAHSWSRMGERRSQSFSQYDEASRTQRIGRSNAPPLLPARSSSNVSSQR